MRALEDTQDEQFVRTASSISNAKALFEFLVGSSQVAALTKALFEGDVKVTQIDEFVRKLLQDFRQGRIFVWDVSIASIAVAIRSYPGRFATDFLDELGALQIQEIPLAPRVASYARKARAESVAAAAGGEPFAHLGIVYARAAAWP